MTAPCARGVATRARMSPSSRSTRRSRSAPHISSRARRPMPRRPPRRRSCGRGWRCGASARAPSSAPGCSRSSPTRRATACAAGGGARAWPSAPRASSPGRRPPREHRELGDGRLREALAGAAGARPQRARLPLRARPRRAARPPPCSASRAAPSSRARRARSIACAASWRADMTLERDLQALAGGFPEAPDLAPRVLAAAGARRRAQAAPAARRRARARALPARAGDRAGRLARPARPRARDVRAAQRDGRARRATCRRSARPTAQRLQLGSRDLAGAGAQRARGARRARRASSARRTGSSRSTLQIGVDVTFVVRAGHRSRRASASAGACS